MTTVPDFSLASPDLQTTLFHTQRTARSEQKETPCHISKTHTVQNPSWLPSVTPELSDSLRPQNSRGGGRPEMGTTPEPHLPTPRFCNFIVTASGHASNGSRTSSHSCDTSVVPGSSKNFRSSPATNNSAQSSRIPPTQPRNTQNVPLLVL